MINEKDILARLQAGESLDDIANEMTKALNNAKVTYAEEERKRKEEEAKAKREEKLDEKAEAFIEAVIDYIKEYDESIFASLGVDLEQTPMVNLIEEVRTGFDGMLEMAKTMPGLVNTIIGATTAEAKKEEPEEPKEEKKPARGLRAKAGLMTEAEVNKVLEEWVNQLF